MEFLTEKDVDFNKLRYTEIKTADEFRKVWKQLQTAHLVRSYDKYQCLRAMKAMGLNDEHFVYQVARLTMQAAGFLFEYGVICCPNVGAPRCLIPSKLGEFMAEFQDMFADEISFGTIEVKPCSYIPNRILTTTLKSYPATTLEFFFNARWSKLPHIDGCSRVRIPCAHAFDITMLKGCGSEASRKVKLAFYNAVLQFGFGTYMNDRTPHDI